ncbi:phosphate ABC transporter permease PstA [Endothiovibrio diazotrophicus]
MKEWFKSGVPWVWLTAGSVSISVIMVVGLLVLIAVRGLGHFWPHSVVEFDYRNNDGSQEQVLAEVVEEEEIPVARLASAGYTGEMSGKKLISRYLVKTGNRDVSGLDFRWLVEPSIAKRSHPEEVMTIERREWGNFYGRLQAIKEGGKVVAEGDAAWDALYPRLDRALKIYDEIYHIEKSEIGAVNYGLERLRLKHRRLELDDAVTPERLADLEASRKQYDDRYVDLQRRLNDLYVEFKRDSLTATVADGREVEIPLAKVVRVFRPNAMSLPQKLGHYVEKVWEFVSDDPREANTEGGIFPAIFGTVLMVMLMSVFVTPFGVIAAVYLREYAKQGFVTRVIRIAVNNLAGVPSIVYGVFGLGFFVYFLGSHIDQLLFPEALPAPTFGTPGLMWSSITLALLTLPVVIVATEEGLSRIPSSIREGSLALGATKAETLWRTVLPMASPAIMTGLILAVARAAGEVAPLMLVGVVKLAPSLPLDGNSPFLHLDRKFMHLGFHIYDVGFQSPNVEAARPLVYATALLLVLVIVALNLAAIAIRNRLREKYKALEA